MQKSYFQVYCLQVDFTQASIKHLDFLFAEYEPRCFLFAVFECFRRLALTGLLIFIYPGSATQITVGLFIALITQRVLSNSNPYIEDTDDYLANLGQFQIVLVFLASMVLLVKRMPEQDGAPGNLFKGPLFAFVLVAIGLMSLLATACTLIIEYCDVESAKEVVEKISAKLSKRSDKEHWREREALGDEDSEDVVEIQIDGAPEGDVVGVLQAAPTPEGKVVGVLSEAPAASAAEGPAPAAGGWLSSIAGTKRPAAREARGAPEAKTGEAPAGPDAGARSFD